MGFNPLTIGAGRSAEAGVVDGSEEFRGFNPLTIGAGRSATIPTFPLNFMALQLLFS